MVDQIEEDHPACTSAVLKSVGAAPDESTYLAGVRAKPLVAIGGSRGGVCLPRCERNSTLP